MTLTEHQPATTVVRHTSALGFRRWAIIASLGLSWVLVLASMFVDPAPGEDGADMVRAYTDDTGASGLHTNLIHYGFALMAPAVYGMVGLARARGAAIANIAGALAVVGLSTLPGLVLLDFSLVAATQATDLDTAMAMSEQMDALPALTAIVLPAFLAAVLALPVACLALWRAGLFPWFAPVLALAGGVAAQVTPWWLIGFGVHTAVLIFLAYLLWRVPLRQWFPSVPAADH